MADAFAAGPYARWDALLTELDLAHDLCQTFREVVNDPAAVEADLLQSVHYDYSGTDVRLVRSPVQFGSGTPDTEPARGVGADTEAVLAEYGYTPEEIATLKAKKVIGMDGDPDVFSRSWSSKFDGK